MRHAMKVTSSTGIAIIVLQAVTGCTVATKDVIADSGRYMAQTFTPEQLPSKIRATIERGPAVPARFKSIHVTYVIDEDTEGRKETVTSVTDLTSLGNGYVQIRNELSKNSVPYRINLALSVGGIYRVKTQVVFLGQANGLPPRETKDMTRFDRGLITPVAGETYHSDSTTGGNQQLVNFVPENVSCTAGPVYSASKIMTSLPGDALSFDCTVIGLNNVVVYKARYSWLFAYGVGLQEELADARSKSRYTVTALSVGS